MSGAKPEWWTWQRVSAWPCRWHVMMSLASGAAHPPLVKRRWCGVAEEGENRAADDRGGSDRRLWADDFLLSEPVYWRMPGLECEWNPCQHLCHVSSYSKKNVCNFTLAVPASHPYLLVSFTGVKVARTCVAASVNSEPGPRDACLESFAGFFKKANPTRDQGFMINLSCLSWHIDRHLLNLLGAVSSPVPTE